MRLPGQRLLSQLHVRRLLLRRLLLQSLVLRTHLIYVEHHPLKHRHPAVNQSQLGPVIENGNNGGTPNGLAEPEAATAAPYEEDEAAATTEAALGACVHGG